MAVYVIADIHLALGDLSKSMEEFGGKWINYTEKIKTRWQNTVKENDTVIIAGDISWGMKLRDVKADFDFINSLPGKKILMKGNHDYWWQTAKKLDDYIEQNGYRMLFLQNNAYEAEKMIVCGTRGWYTDDKSIANMTVENSKIVAREVGRLRLSLDCAKKMNKDNKEIVAFMHFPPVFEDYVCCELVEILKEYGVERCYFGHIHGNYTCQMEREYEGVKFTLISADYLDFTPYLIENS